MWSGFLKLKKKNLNYSTIKTFNRVNIHAEAMVWVYAPTNFNFCVFQPCSIYLYTSTYYIYLFTPAQSVYSILNTTICIKAYFNSFYLNYINLWQRIFFTFSNIFFKSLKFTGKGYRVYKGFRNILALQFNHSHRVYTYLQSVGFKFLNKYHFIFFNLNSLHLNLFSFLFKSKRPVNLYTSRGIRFTKQIMFKKTGKISTY